MYAMIKEEVIQALVESTPTQEEYRYNKEQPSVLLQRDDDTSIPTKREKDFLREVLGLVEARAE